MDLYTKPDLEHSILITIDMQNDFVQSSSPFAIEGTEEVIPNITQLLKCYRSLRYPILHVVRLYEANGSNSDLCRKNLIKSGAQIVTPGSNGSELVKEIRPTNYKKLNYEKLYKGLFQRINLDEWIMYKPRWGAFYKTNLESFLHQINIDTLVFTGCNFPNCPRTSIYEASERDFRIIMVSDAVSQIYERGETELSNIGGYLYKTKDILSQLR